MSNAVNYPNNMLKHRKNILTGLSGLINITKNATEYNVLNSNTNKYLENNFNRNANGAESIKDNFYKYIKILKLLYEYNIHYENLLKKYAEQEDILSLKKRPITDKENIELNSVGIRKKIIEIYTKQKLKLRRLLTKIADIMIEKFKNIPDEEYKKIIEYNKIPELLSFIKYLKKKKPNMRIDVNRLIAIINSKKNPIKVNKTLKEINFSKAKNKNNYLNIIHSSIKENDQLKINKINKKIGNSLNELNKIKNIYVNQEIHNNV
jgi:hypothetical protein